MYFDLLNFSCFRISGPESKKFLQSQLSNDISLLERPNGKGPTELKSTQLTSYCNPKGRVISLLKVCCKNSDDYFVIAPSTLIEVTKKRFNMYKLRSNLIISNESEEYSIFALFKDFKNQNIIAEFEESGVKTFLFLDSADADKSQKYLVIVEKKDLPFVTDIFEKKLDCHKKSESFWLTLEMKDGIPWFTSKLTESLLPQQINLDLINAISFKKGCYPGQEVVARMHYLGKPKKRSFLLLGHISQSELQKFQGEHPIAIRSKKQESEVGSLVAFTNLSESFETPCFFGIGEFDLSKMDIAGDGQYYIQLTKGELDLKLGTLPFQKQITEDLKNRIQS